MFIDVTNITDHDDGSATIDFEMDKESEKKFAELGLKYVLTLAAYDVTYDELVAILENNKKSIDV